MGRNNFKGDQEEKEACCEKTNKTVGCGEWKQKIEG